MATNEKLPQAQRYWLHVLGTLNEAQARVFVAQKALEEGRGAVSRLELTGMSRPTILKGWPSWKPVASSPLAPTRDGFAPDPHIKRVLARLVEASTAGDPMSYLLWTNKSTRKKRMEPEYAAEVRRKCYGSCWM